LHTIVCLFHLLLIVFCNHAAKYNGKILVKPSKKSIDKFTENISDIIKRGKAWNQEVLIDNLNPAIIGWTNYHRFVVSSEIFNKLDSRIWNMLWHWAKRRHTRNPIIGLPKDIGIQLEIEIGFS